MNESDFAKHEKMLFVRQLASHEFTFMLRPLCCPNSVTFVHARMVNVIVSMILREVCTKRLDQIHTGAQERLNTADFYGLFCEL
jgi:hypothetical protein